MSWETVTPPITHSDYFNNRMLKQTREAIGREAKARRMTWEQVEAICKKLHGTTKGLSTSQCKKVLEEIRKKRK